MTCSMPSLNLKGLPRSREESNWDPSRSCRRIDGQFMARDIKWLWAYNRHQNTRWP
jgi:hypothetical protein